MTRNQKEVASNYPEIAAALRDQGLGDQGHRRASSSTARSSRSTARRPASSCCSRASTSSAPTPGCCAGARLLLHLRRLYADGRDVRPLPLRERKSVLAGLLSFRDPLRYTEHRDNDGEAYYAEACRQGWEGLIAKRDDAPYRAGRSRDWLKFKCETNQEFVIGGFTDPQRSRIGFGALLLGYYDASGQLVYAGKVGTGFDTRTLRSLHSELSAIERDTPPFGAGDLPRSGVHWTEPSMVAQVGFSEWTRDGQLRHPRFQGLRRDKAATDVVREVPT